MLGILRVPLMEPQFACWARAQILRLSSALFRRYEVQHSGYPFCLYPLISDKHTLGEKMETANRLLKEPRENLDTYS